MQEGPNRHRFGSFRGAWEEKASPVHGGAFGCEARNSCGHFALRREGSYREVEGHSESRAEPKDSLKN